MSHPEPRIVKASQTFGDFTLDPARGFLLRGSEEVKLRPKSFETLRYLVLNQGRLISKEELMRVVWPDSFVSDDSLGHCLMEVRKALGDAHGLLRNVPGRGYIFEVNRATDRSQPALFLASRRLAKHWIAALLAIAGIAVAGTAVYPHFANLRWARASITEVGKLANGGRYFEAFDLAKAILKYLPQQPDVVRLMPGVSSRLSVKTIPPGAHVYLRRFSPDSQGNFPKWEFAGITPLNDLAIGRGDHLLAIEKQGYQRFERSISHTLAAATQFASGPLHLTMISVEQRLVESSRVPDRMVFVQGGNYRLVGWGRPTDSTVQIGDFWVDKYEVSNREFEEFIRAGGYRRRELWTDPFVDKDKSLSWEMAWARFKDRTGLSAPRGWVGGECPRNEAAYPVTGLTWYEAAAYCRFRGKRLPTIFEWEKAARNATTIVWGMVVPWGMATGGIDKHRVNCNSSGPTPVDSFEFGMSPYGALNMAGNVAEWSLNPHAQGFFTTGGGWDAPLYLFSDYGRYPGFHSSDTIGFRCALPLAERRNDSAVPLIASPAPVPHYRPTDKQSFKTWMRHYQYDKTSLEPKVVDVEETADWRREQITYLGANQERVIAYLYLPKGAKPPLQVILSTPGYMPFLGYPVTDTINRRMAPYIRYGRAVFLPTLRGYAERKWPSGYEAPKWDSVAFRERYIEWATDIRRGVDYLETRADIDPKRIAYSNISTSNDGLIYAAVEDRFRSIILIAAGVDHRWTRWIAEANPVNFAPHIRPPKLMLVGRYDEAFLFKTQIEPLYHLLREPKKMVVFDGGHLPPIETSTPAVNTWLDETMGPVERN
jgi:eukaryotic-like serine/threonine-protein kinase